MNALVNFRPVGAEHGQYGMGVRYIGSGGSGGTDIEADIRSLSAGVAQMRAAAANPDAYLDEDGLFRLLQLAHTRLSELELLPPNQSPPPSSVAAGGTRMQLANAALNLFMAWLHLFSGGGLSEDAEGFRGTGACDIVTSGLVSAVASESQFAPVLLGVFSESAGLSFFGAALCSMEEACLPSGIRRLRTVSSRCSVAARRGVGATALKDLIENIEAFRSGLFARLLELAGRPGRRLRVPHFKEFVSEVGGVLTGAYDSTQVFEMGCLLSLQLTLALLAYCPGVPEQDAMDAIDWMTAVVRNLLDQGKSTGGALSSPAAMREWVGDSGLFNVLLQRAGCKTQLHAQHLFATLLSQHVLAPRELVSALASAGVLGHSPAPSPNRLALQAALVASMRSIGAELSGDLTSELCRMDFSELTEQSADLLVRATINTLACGHDPMAVAGNAAEHPLNRTLALPYLLRFLRWGLCQSRPQQAMLEHVRRLLLFALVQHPAFRPLLPTIAAEALSLALAPIVTEHRASVLRNVRTLGALAVDICRVGAARSAEAGVTKVAQTTASAIAKLCGALPPIGEEVALSADESHAWLAAFADTLACYLQLPGAEIATQQVGTLWSRTTVRPVLGLSVPTAAMQYFKLAFLSQPQASSALLAPLHAAANPPPEVRLAYASIFCPASFEDDPPPMPSNFFLPDVEVEESCAVMQEFGRLPSLGSPGRLPRSLRRSDSDHDEADLAAHGLEGESLDMVATSMGITLPETSASTPALRLDRIQCVVQGHGGALLGELTVYNAVERRLWDEFEHRGRVEDGDALRQRDAAAMRCLAALDHEVNMAGHAGRELAAPVTEARAKFSSLCDLIQAGVADRTSTELWQQEEAFAQAEEAYLAERATCARARARSRRRGSPEQAETWSSNLKQARAVYLQAKLQLVVTLRHLAARAQLGLVEVIGATGLARALRAVGASHGDTLLERVLRHGPWVVAQAEGDADFEDLDDEGVVQQPHYQAPAPNLQAGGSLPSRSVAEVRKLDRPGGLVCYTDVQPMSHGSKVFVARRFGTVVVLKAWAASQESMCWREMRALTALRQSCVVSLHGFFAGSGGMTYLELTCCSGGTLQTWCESHGGEVVAQDLEMFVKCLSIFRQLWQAVAFLHAREAVHGDVCLSNVLLTPDCKPVLADFKRCILGGDSPDASELPKPSPGYEAPEFEGSIEPGLPTAAADIYAAGVAMAKAFLGVELEVNSCPYHPTRGQRSLPDRRADVDLVDLLHLVLSAEPQSRLAATDVSCHRALDPSQVLRRNGMFVAGNRGDAFLRAAEQLRDKYRGKRIDETLMFSREHVFNAITTSKIREWPEEALLGEWRVTLDDESGVDGGGLRRELITLFFEQLEQSSAVLGTSTDSMAQPTIFVNDRQRAALSPQQLRQVWGAVGAMVLRAVVHFGHAPICFASVVFDCAFGRIGKLPPDDNDDDDSLDGVVDRTILLRQSRGDDWARSEMLDLLGRLRQADPAKEASYRWMLGQRSKVTSPELEGSSSSSFVIPVSAWQTIEVMLEPFSYRFLQRSSTAQADGSVLHSGAVLEWTLMWDIYLKYIGSGDRWLAYEAFADGLTARGRRLEMWSNITGDQLSEALEGSPLTADVLLANLEFKPDYGYNKQIQGFQRVIQEFSIEELSMFLRYATGIGRLPASKRFPGGQKLTIRFLPDDLDKLPTAKTCIWVVDVPPYDDIGHMRDKLKQAIAAPQPFAIS